MVQLFQAPPQQKMLPPIPQDRPVYRILNEQGFYGPNDTLFQEGEIIVYDDTPNEDMEPMNELARVALEKYIDTLEESARVVAEKNGRSYAGRPRSKNEMLEFASQDARRLQTIGNQGGVPIMGAKKRGRPRIQRVGDPVVSEMGGNDAAAEARKARVGKLG